jgi:hypothetical protein
MAKNSFNIPRHWWGKIIGGVIGLFRGGLLGALVGALLGHLVDRFLAGIVGVGATQKAFYDALFASLGHLSKADGRVTETEIRMVEALMQQMRSAARAAARDPPVQPGQASRFRPRGHAAAFRAALGSARTAPCSWTS